MQKKLNEKRFFGVLFLIFALVGVSDVFAATKKSGVDTNSRRYTKQDALSYEISTIRKFSEEETVKALWRAKLLLNTNSSNADCKSLFTDFANKTKSLYDKAVASKDYLSARKYLESLSAVGLDVSGLSLSSSELNEIIRKNVPGFSKVVNKKNTLGACINGTVTVFVDKGIKFENGVGYNDSVLGSGFFISKNGYIVTNHHVIEDCVNPEYNGFARLYIRLAEDPDTKIPAKIIGYDSSIDLALLKTEVDAPYVFNLGSSSDLDIGDKVYAIGSPLGLERTLTSGIISAKDRELFSSGKVFQIDAAVNSGNSGGPLIDEHGNVQAVVFAGVPLYQGLNFAIPVEYLKEDLPFLFGKGERKHSWIGCYGKTKRMPGSGAASEGLSIDYVMPGSSADKAGLAVGDLIYEVSGETISSLDDMKNCYLKRSNGTILCVKALDSKGKNKVCLVYLDERPKLPGKEVYLRDVPSSALVPLLGMELKPSSTQNKKLYVITRIIKGSIADESNFSVDDPIQIVKIEIDKNETDYASVQLYAKKRKNGFIDIAIGYTTPLDTQFYF